MNISSVIEQLGFPPNHVKIYLAALKMGECSISELAEKVGMPRTSVTQIAQAMQKEGLLNTYAKRGKHFWSAANPDSLLNTIKDHESSLRTILPALHAMRPDRHSNKPAIRVYEGVEELRLIFDDIIATKHHILGVISWDDIIEHMGQEFLNDFIERRNASFLKIRLITPRSETSSDLKKRDASELRHTRFLPAHIELRRISNFVYGNKTVLISLNKRIPTGTIIEDPDIVHAMTLYFESLWLHCTDK
jgi:sugar-specific transcriptional regulator TrmB